MRESCNAILESEMLVQRRLTTHRGRALNVVGFIDVFYNPRRRHTSIGKISAMEFGRRMVRPPDV